MRGVQEYSVKVYQSDFGQPLAGWTLEGPLKNSIVGGDNKSARWFYFISILVLQDTGHYDTEAHWPCWGHRVQLLR